MATNVAEFNITSLIHELTTGEKYKLPDVEDKKPDKATITEIIEEEEEEEEQEVSEEKEDASSKCEKEKSSNIEGKCIIQHYHYLCHLLIATFVILSSWLFPPCKSNW